MADLSVRARRLLARGINYRNPAFRRAVFIGTGTRGHRTLGDLHVLSKAPSGTQPSFGIVVAGLSTPLSVNVSGSTVTVNSATSGAGAATSTYKQVHDALRASAPAMALIWPSLRGSGSAVVSASAVSALTPSNT